MTTGPVNHTRQPTRRFGMTDVVMLTILLGTLAVVFLLGIFLLTDITTRTISGTTTTIDTKFASSDIVAILSPVLGVIGTVAAGIFGYSLGTQGSSEAHQNASEAARQTEVARRETGDTTAAASTLVETVNRIAGQARRGGAGVSGKHELSQDDINTLLAATETTARGMRIAGRQNIESPPDPPDL